MDESSASLDRVAASSRFSGVVRIDRGGRVAVARAYGWAHRGLAVANTVDGQFGIASGTKGLTALTIVSLIEQGRLELATTARSLLGADLPLISDDVTVEQLLAHRSGIGDYLDETTCPDLNDYVMAVPVHELAANEDYLRVLAGHPAKWPPGERFCYCNSGYVVLALMAERGTGTPFPDLVDQCVCRPAGMVDTAFLRSDELPGRAAVGYLTVNGARSNVLHLPVRGSGDGGIYSTAADIHSLWAAFFAGRIVSRDWVSEMLRPRSHVPPEGRGYGLGFWRREWGDAVMLEGGDAGVTFRTVHDPSEGFTYTVLANVSRLGRAIVRHIEEVLAA